MGMGGEGEEEGVLATSKWAIVLAGKSNECTKPWNPNMTASPLHTLAAVPFCWEEEPGKPKHKHVSTHHYTKCLELPPRLLLSGYPREFTKLPLPASGALVVTGRRGGHGGKSWTLGFWKGKEKGKRDVGRGSYVFPSCVYRESGREQDDGGGGINTSLEISRTERPRSLYSLSTQRSHFWTSVYKGLKHMTPWKCKKLRREGF